MTASRKPAGTPVGGQFAAKAHTEPSVDVISGIEASADCPEGRSQIAHAGEALDRVREALRQILRGRRKSMVRIEYSDVRDVGWDPPDGRTRCFDSGCVSVRYDTPVATIKVAEGGHYEIDATAGPGRMTALPGGRGSHAWAYLHGDSSPEQVARWMQWAFLDADTAGEPLT